MHGRGVGNFQTGVTLLEVTVVIALLATLLGLSVLAFKNANRDLGVRASANHCVTLVRAVGERARASRAPASLVINVAENSVCTRTEETVQAWNFEDDRGAFGQTSTASKVTSAPGREGLAARFSGSSWLKCGPIPVYARDQGIGIEFWLWRSASGGRRTICTVGGQGEIWMNPTGRLYARFGEFSINSGNVSVPADDWVRVHVFHDGTEGRIIVNDYLAVVRAGPLSWSGDTPLTIGSGKDGLVGLVDSFRVNVVIPREKYYLPAETRFELPRDVKLKGKEFVISFTAEGRLDPARHAAPVSFSVKSQADEKTITISRWGGIAR